MVKIMAVCNICCLDIMDNKYFENALSGFAFDMAAGSAICHLADKGYTVKYIKEKLEYPVPFDKIQKTVWGYLLEEKVILVEEPGKASVKDKIVYMEKLGKYGRKSFCGKVVTEKDYSGISWKVEEYGLMGKTGFSNYIAEKCFQNGRNTAYVSCDFGIIKRKNQCGYEKILSLLDSRQKEYIEGLPWPDRRVYHQADLRMQEITGTLYERGLYTGCFYFMELGEKIVLHI